MACPDWRVDVNWQENMRRVLGPKAQAEWQNTSMMMGWCLYRTQAGQIPKLFRPLDPAEAETVGRLTAWKVPRYVIRALLGLPSSVEGYEDSFYRLGYEDEARILGEVPDFEHEQQNDPSQAGASNGVGSHTEVQCGVHETPYRIQENALGPLGAMNASGELQDFEPVHQGNLPQEEKSSRAGNSRQRSFKPEADTSEGINGLRGFDNSAHRKPNKRIRRGGSRSVGNNTEGPHETDPDTWDMISNLEELQDAMKDWAEEISSKRKQLRKLNKKLRKGGSRSVGNSTEGPHETDFYTWDMISDLEELQDTMKDWVQDISLERKQLKLKEKLRKGGSRSVGNSTKNPIKSEWDGSDP